MLISGIVIEIGIMTDTKETKRNTMMRSMMRLMIGMIVTQNVAHDHASVTSIVRNKSAGRSVSVVVIRTITAEPYDCSETP